MRDLILGFLVGEHKMGEIGGSNLGANYDSANNTQKKGVSWYRCSSKIDKIPEKYIWRSSSLVNQQVESLQKLSGKLKLKLISMYLFQDTNIMSLKQKKTKPKLRKNFQIWSLYLRTPITTIYRTKHKIVRHIYLSH